MKSAEDQDILRKKLHDAIDKMIDGNGGIIKRVTYYHSSATFIETGYGTFMLRMVGYKPEMATLDEFENPVK